jgi:hypothetical protein
VGGETSKDLFLSKSFLRKGKMIYLLLQESKIYHIEGYYDGKKYLVVKDPTFQEAGRIGLWTKADAQSYFDDLTVSGK